MFLSNTPGIKTVGRLDSAWSSVIRSTALAVILIRAGLGLDPQKLRSGVNSLLSTFYLISYVSLLAY